MKTLIGTALVFFVGMAGGSQATAAGEEAAYPAQPVKLVIPYPPGGATDTIARGLADRLSKLWNQPVILDNKPGASEAIAAQTVAASKPNGYTLLIASDAAFVTNGLLKKNLGYDPKTAFAPILRVSEGSGVLVVKPDFPSRSLKDLLARAQQEPGRVTYGSEGPRSPSEFRMRILGEATGGYKFSHIPYTSSTAVLTDALGGRLDSAWLPPHLAKPHVESKALIPVAVSGSQRLWMFPDVPTIQEQGFENADVSFKQLLAAPAGTPVALINKIAQDVASVIREPSFGQSYFRPIGYTLIGDGPAAFEQYLIEARKRLADVVLKAGMQPE